MKNGAPVIREINFEDAEGGHRSEKILRGALGGSPAELFIDIRQRDENFTTTTDRTVSHIKLDTSSFLNGIALLLLDFVRGEESEETA